MARKPRIHFENAIYHVIARGNNKEDIFLSAADKRKYLDLVVKYKRLYDFEPYAYVLMNNHFHLLLAVHQWPLSKIMQGLQQTYTQYYNRKYEHAGHVFQQRYKAFLCSNDAYLLALVCYIHRNPQRANFPAGLSYPWSSHKEYLTGQGIIVNPLFVLEMFDKDVTRAVRRYADLVCQDQMEPSPAANPPQPVTTKCAASKQVTTITGGETAATYGTSFADVARQVAGEMQVPLEKLMGNCRLRKVVRARHVLIYRAIAAQLCTRSELARQLGVDPAIITRVYQRMRQESKVEQ